MAENNGSASTGRRFAIRLTGFGPGTSPEELIPALQRLYPGKTPEQIRGALKSLPLLLTGGATEQQARKIKPFLESKGAVLKITHVPAEKGTTAKAETATGPDPVAPAPVMAPPEKEPSGAERRKRPVSTRESRSTPWASGRSWTVPFVSCANISGCCSLWS